MWWRSVIWTGIVFGTMFWIVPQVLWLIGRCVCRIFAYRLPYAPFGYTALAIVLVLWGALAYGYMRGRFLIRTTEVTYESASLPAAFDGYRILHLSDLHADSFDRPGHLQRIIDAANALNADIILFTGDMTTGRIGGLYPHTEALRSLHARDGVVSTLGNHDFFIYDPALRSDEARCAMADSLTRYEREELGWTVLRNDHLTLRRGEEQMTVAGVDNINGQQGFRTIQKGDLRTALQGTEGTFTVLLTHDPSHWRAEVLPQSDVQLTLSGHTHASQVRLFGWSLSRLMFHECDGRYDRDGRMLYVNAGLGCTAPFRIGCPSELTLITLRCAVRDKKTPMP